MYTTCYNHIGMNKRPNRKKETIKRVLTYTTMTLSVFAIASILVFVLLGYRIDTNSGQIEQSALLQFESVPAGATVIVDGKPLKSKTPTKSTVLSGSHTIVFKKDGYNDWAKTLDAVPGTLTWLNYAKLIPNNIITEKILDFKSVYASLGSVDGKDMLIQQTAIDPIFDVIDLKSDNVKQSTITIPSNAYSSAGVAGVVHNFRINQLDKSGRYSVIEHTYGDKKEWLVMDTKDVAKTKNVSVLMNVNISSIAFSGTNGSVLYALIGGDVRKLDLSSDTISKALVSGVNSFEVYNTGVITYVGKSQSDATKRVVGLYVEGDVTPHILRTVDGDFSVPLRVSTTHYFDKDFIAISYGQKVDILSGLYPASGSEESTSLSDLASFSFDANVDLLSFSPKGDYLLAMSGLNVTSYNIEHQISGNFAFASPVSSIKWLDGNHIWSDSDGKLMIRDFDGINNSMISTVVAGQGVALTSNDRYIYSIGSAANGYQLQRVRLQLP